MNLAKVRTVFRTLFKFSDGLVEQFYVFMWAREIARALRYRIAPNRSAHSTFSNVVKQLDRVGIRWQTVLVGKNRWKRKKCVRAASCVPVCGRIERIGFVIHRWHTTTCNQRAATSGCHVKTPDFADRLFLCDATRISLWRRWHLSIPARYDPDCKENTEDSHYQSCNDKVRMDTVTQEVPLSGNNHAIQEKIGFRDASQRHQQSYCCNDDSPRIVHHCFSSAFASGACDERRRFNCW